MAVYEFQAIVHGCYKIGKFTNLTSQKINKANLLKSTTHKISSMGKIDASKT